ncbi:GNAT superfamily N-acetyltransferase [Nocardia transvalensis]|uniref:GNAT superfamily N-acetyltransferase n=1 Tax=Nocardia transvalensis TaxID=37333 RepID=A0A7W9UMC0_9NOCA|nr:GNAT superfamily N-acetyltransferase [Nocardia transvalensis]
MRVDDFDDAEFAPYLERAGEAGVTFTTLAGLGDTEDNRRAVYELNRICAADIPERGEFFSYAEYVAQRFEARGYDPAGVILAVRAGELVGMSAVSLHAEPGVAFSEMTGVLRPFRGHGLSLALKLLAITFARSAGYRWMVTFHHPRNAAAIAMNQRLGFHMYGEDQAGRV